MRSLRRPATVATIVAALLVAAGAAEAACTRLAFSVNDYGKQGPTDDAKKLLDGHIAKWTSERGIKSYTVGKKDVSCELFLDLIVFDEYTCKAEATVCWAGPPAKDQPGATPASVKATRTKADPGTAAPKSDPAKAAPKATPKAAEPAKSAS